jgi:hypothetical protein
MMNVMENALASQPLISTDKGVGISGKGTGNQRRKRLHTASSLTITVYLISDSFFNT